MLKRNSCKIKWKSSLLCVTWVALWPAALSYRSTLIPEVLSSNPSADCVNGGFSDHLNGGTIYYPCSVANVPADSISSPFSLQMLSNAAIAVGNTGKTRWLAGMKHIVPFTISKWKSDCQIKKPVHIIKNKPKQLQLHINKGERFINISNKIENQSLKKGSSKKTIWITEIHEIWNQADHICRIWLEISFVHFNTYH